MRAYIMMSGVIFAVLVFAHAARLVVEGTGVLRQPDFAAATVLALAMSAWAFWLLRKGRK